MSEYVSIGDESFLAYTSNNLPDPIDLTLAIQNQLSSFPAIVTKTATYVAGMEDSTAPLQDVYYYTSANLNNPIDFITKTNLQLIDWPLLLTVEKTGDWVLQQSYSVVPGNRTVYTIDFASRTSFNTDNDLSFDPPQYWIGA